jgi:hypothetical protein
MMDELGVVVLSGALLASIAGIVKIIWIYVLKMGR